MRVVFRKAPCLAEPLFGDAGEPFAESVDLASLGAILKLSREVFKRVGRELRNRRYRTRRRLSDKDLFKRPEGVPEDWVRKPSDKGEGVKFVDPKSKNSTYVRIQRGNPQSPNQGQRTDYVRWQKNGVSLDKNGMAVQKQSFESHIPIENFVFIKDLF